MSSSNGSSQAPPINKDQLYGEYLDEARKRSRFGLRVAHKALDMREDDMNIDASRKGLGWKELLVIAAMVAAGAWGTYELVQSQSVGSPSPAPTAGSPADSEYEVRFYDAQGNPIHLDRWPGKSE